MRAFGCVGAFAVCAALLAPSATHAATTNLDLSTAVVTGGAGFIAHEGRLRFDADTPGQTATFAFSSVPGERYSISVIGQNNQSTSFFQFLIDADGAGPGGFKQLGSNFNFGSGFNTVTLPTLADLGTLDFLQIVTVALPTTAPGRSLESL